MGGGIGYNSGTTLTNNYSTGNVTGTAGVGGAGAIGNDGNTSLAGIAGSNGAVGGIAYVGGLIGYNLNGQIINSYASGGTVTVLGGTGGVAGNG